MIEDTDETVQDRIYRINVGKRPTGARIDAYLSRRFPDYSRTFIQKLIRNGRVRVDGAVVKPSYSPGGGEEIVAEVPTVSRGQIEAENIGLDIIYEDEWLLVINKPADMVVHPSRGHCSGTLVNAAAYHCSELVAGDDSLRPGIIHRLDRDTTGVIVMVKDGSIHEKMAEQFEKRTVEKEYIAICEGRFELDSDLIDVPIGKNDRIKEKMAVRHDCGKSASTIYEVIERIGAYTLVRCRPVSGRTHQIRVHMRYVGHPVVCDRVYGNGSAVFRSDITGEELLQPEKPLIDRQALHAKSISLFHPARQKNMTFEAPLPEDMMRLLEALRSAARDASPADQMPFPCNDRQEQALENDCKQKQRPDQSKNK